MQTLKARGFLERYLRALPRSYHDDALAPRAPSWVPVEEAAIHYNACQALGRGEAELEQLSEAVVTSIGNTMLSTFTRASRGAESGTPWLRWAKPSGYFRVSSAAAPSA